LPRQVRDISVFGLAGAALRAIKTAGEKAEAANTGVFNFTIYGISNWTQSRWAAFELLLKFIMRREEMFTRVLFGK
jgi:hypothetical protein